MWMVSSPILNIVPFEVSWVVPPWSTLPSILGWSTVLGFQHSLLLQSFKCLFFLPESHFHTPRDEPHGQICHSSSPTPQYQFTCGWFYLFIRIFQVRKHLPTIWQTIGCHLFCNLPSQSHLAAFGITPILSCLSLGIGTRYDSISCSIFSWLCKTSTECWFHAS